MSNIDYWALLSRWVHIVAAITAIGGAMFIRFVLMPAAKDALPHEDDHQRLQQAVRARWMRFVHACIALLLITGFVNFWMLAIRPRIPAIPYHPIFGLKLLAALFVFFVASALSGTAPGFAGMRAARGRWLGALLIAAALIVLLSALLGQIRAAA